MPFFSRKRPGQGKGEQDGQPRECQHASLAPRWDSAPDMGKRDKVSTYRCASCGAEFEATEGEALIAGQEARPRGLLGGDERQ